MTSIVNYFLILHPQVKLLAKSGKFYQKFWQYYIILFDGHIVEEEACVIGLGMADGDELALLPRTVIGRKENLFLQLFIGIEVVNIFVNLLSLIFLGSS